MLSVVDLHTGVARTVTPGCVAIKINYITQRQQEQSANGERTVYGRPHTIGHMTMTRSHRP